MSEAEPKLYKVDLGHAVKDQIQAIKATCKQPRQLDQFIDILEKAVQHFRTEPLAWGDPEYRSKYVDGVVCHALLRPVAFRFVIYEPVRAVVLTAVRLYADFD